MILDSLEQRLRDIQNFGEEGGVVPVIDVAATSTFLNPNDMTKTFQGELEGCYLYSRHSNPTVQMFSKKMAAMEGMEAALGVSSGMAAISCSIEQLLPQGGEVISSQTVYGGTYALFKNIFPSQGIHVKFVNIDDLSEVEKAITSKSKVLYVETLSNPMLSLAHLSKLSELCKKYKLTFVVDNTFTPTLITPVQFGADVVIHSCTKFISGASDMIAGVIVSSRAFINSLIDLNHGRVMLKGPVMDARIAHELYLRLDHLPIRMRAHSVAAQYLAEKMENAGIKVVYPGLKSHPNHELFRQSMNKEIGFGGMLTIDLGTPELAMKLAAKLQLEKFGLYAVSLGFSRTLVTCPAITTSSEVSDEDQKKMKLSPGLVRMSVGFLGSNEVLAERFFKCYQDIIS
jgi:methionine-gamma-lyase